MKNQVQLCTYVDRLSGDIQSLKHLLSTRLLGLFGSVHLLPFFTPIDGSDAGFDPIDHTEVDPRLGVWQDVRELAQHIDIMADVIVNHVSADSALFEHYLKHGQESPYAGLFLHFDKVFPNGASAADLLAIYRASPGLPLTIATLASGERKLLWSSFTPKQLDIDVTHPQGAQYLRSILQALASSGVRQIRLDAVGYTIKKAGSSCFMLPETMQFIAEFSAQAKALNLATLVEVHSHYLTQMAIAKQVDWVYDFALPPLVLHALFFHTSSYLQHWIVIRPHNAINVLDTHDGIGVIDIGADMQAGVAKPGLVPETDMAKLVEKIHCNSRNESREASGAAAANLDLYQVNCTFYDALARHDAHYLMARAIQFFLPGIPQVYYMGLLAEPNDLALLARTGVGRDINRHYFDSQGIDSALARPVVQDLLALIRLRNAHLAFAGQFSSTSTHAQQLSISWQNAEHSCMLELDFAKLEFVLRYSSDEMPSTLATLNFLSTQPKT